MAVARERRSRIREQSGHAFRCSLPRLTKFKGVGSQIAPVGHDLPFQTLILSVGAVDIDLGRKTVAREAAVRRRARHIRPGAVRMMGQRDWENGQTRDEAEQSEGKHVGLKGHTTVQKEEVALAGGAMSALASSVDGNEEGKVRPRDSGSYAF